MPKPVIGFHFQEIPLEEAKNTLLAGDGDYAELKEALLDKLPKLPPTSAFAFGLPGGKEVPEDQRKGVSMAINLTLTKASLPWRVRYSGTKKLFICVPHMKKSSRNLYVPKSNYNPNTKTEEMNVLKLMKEGMSASQISSKLGLPKSRLYYLVYKKFGSRAKEKVNGGGK